MLLCTVAAAVAIAVVGAFPLLSLLLVVVAIVTAASLVVSCQFL